MNDTQIILLLLSRALLYAYVLYKAWKYRQSVVVISAFWLGTMAVAAMLAAFSTTFADQIVRTFSGYTIALTMFMVAHTSKEMEPKLKQ